MVLDSVQLFLGYKFQGSNVLIKVLQRLEVQMINVNKDRLIWYFTKENTFILTLLFPFLFGTSGND